MWIGFAKESDEMGVCATIGIEGKGVKEGGTIYCYNSEPVPFA